MVSSRIHPIGLHSGGGSSSSPLLKYEDVLKKFCKNRVSIPSKKDVIKKIDQIKTLPNRAEALQQLRRFRDDFSHVEIQDKHGGCLKPKSAEDREAKQRKILEYLNQAINQTIPAIHISNPFTTPTLIPRITDAWDDPSPTGSTPFTTVTTTTSAPIPRIAVAQARPSHAESAQLIAFNEKLRNVTTGTGVISLLKRSSRKSFYRFVDTLDLSRRNLSAKNITTIMTLLPSQLRNLDVSNSELGPTGAAAIGQGMANTPHLQHLNVHYNKIGGFGAAAIGQGMAHTPLLQHLDVSANQIGDGGASDIGQGIAHTPLLQHLDIGGNRIGDTGAAAIGQGMVHTPHLQHLDVRGNYIRNAGASTIGQGMVHTPHLQHLNVYYNQIGDAGATAIGQGMAHTPHLQHLDVGFNKIGDAGASAISQGMAHTPLLQRLDIHNNRIATLTLPEHLTNRITIDAINNRFSAAEVTRIQRLLQNSPATIQLNIYEPPAPRTHVLGVAAEDTRSLSQIVADYKNQSTTSTSSSNIWDSTTPEFTTFRTFLLRIIDTADAKNPETRPKIMQSLAKILELMERNPEFRSACLGIADEAISSCGDRVGLGLVNMQIQLQTYPKGGINRSNILGIGRNLSRFDEIYKIAHEKVEQMRGEIDEIGVYLALLIGLNKRLGLGLDTTQMLYRACSRISEEDIAAAERTIRTKEPNSTYEFLIDYPPCSSIFSKEFEEISARLDDEQNNLENNAEQMTSANYQTMFKILGLVIKDEKIKFLKRDLPLQDVR